MTPGIRLLFGEGESELPNKTVNNINYLHPADTSVHDILDLTFEPLSVLVDVHAKFNMSNIINTTTFKLMEKLDGTYRQTKIWVWKTDNDNSGDNTMTLEFVGVGLDAKITIQSDLAESSPRNIVGKKALYTY